ncbi:hypothetical protein [Modestobacter italicus]|nr:hypothetical protein [Modestobacter marinus]
MPWWAWALIAWCVLGAAGAFGVAAVMRNMKDAQRDHDLDGPPDDPDGP